MSKSNDAPTGPLVYDGGDQGIFIVGVPARNLSAEEVKRYWPAIKAAQDAMGLILYTAIAAEPKHVVTAIQQDSK